MLTHEYTYASAAVEPLTGILDTLIVFDSLDALEDQLELELKVVTTQVVQNNISTSDSKNAMVAYNKQHGNTPQS
jgi:hypothetical protein